MRRLTLNFCAALLSGCSFISVGATAQVWPDSRPEIMAPAATQHSNRESTVTQPNHSAPSTKVGTVPSARRVSASPQVIPPKSVAPGRSAPARVMSPPQADRMGGSGSSGIAASPSQGNTTTPRNLLPSRPPRVSYSNGMLSIVADNSTLADVLSAVRQKTGAYIEAPPSAASERIVISIGPAPANAVLTSLLNGSRFDYIILGSTQAQGAPQRLILREKQGSAQASAASPGNTGMASNPSRNIAASPVNQLPPEAPEAEEESPPEADIPEEVQPDVQQQQPVAGQPGQQGQPQVKTPEQLLEELKQMQQQQQLQQQQQGNQPGSQPQSNESVPRAQTGDESQQEQQQQMQPQQPADNEPPPDF